MKIKIHYSLRAHYKKRFDTKGNKKKLKAFDFLSNNLNIFVN